MYRTPGLMRSTLLLALTLLAAGSAALAAGGQRPAVLRGVTRVLFYGDSLTDGSSYPDYVVNTLNRELPEANFELLNAAVAGDTAARLRLRLEADVLALKPHLVVICIGTNDCLGKRPPPDFEADLEDIVSRILATSAKVVLMTPSHLGKAEPEQRFQAYLAAIRRVARSRKLLVADAHAEFLRGEKQGREMLGADGVHHGKNGFEGMARAVLDAFGLKGVQVDLKVRPWPYLLTQWESSAPVPKTSAKPLAPARATGWKPYDAAAARKQPNWWDSPFAERGGWMPFAAGQPKAPSLAYGRTIYRAKQAGRVELQVGGSRPLVVWLNGKEVWRGGRPHGYHPNADRVVVPVRAGDNQVIVVSTYVAFVGMRPLRASEGGK